MMRTPVRSSTLVSVGYDEAKQVLEIEFRRNSVYQYSGVPRPIYKQLMAASSKGSYFDRRIRNQFKTMRIS
ncbi:KTSC domain-containing protein [Bradyrhizobium elkanii]|nr:KTSC domain-containing protein [Bradyrhizobium elkanii]